MEANANDFLDAVRRAMRPGPVRRYADADGDEDAEDYGVRVDPASRQYDELAEEDSNAVVLP